MLVRPAGNEPLLQMPLFPLPNTVLFPRAIIPLHIFEERYKAMMADVLGGTRQLAMALLRPGWEKCYYSRPAIEPVVCVGAIITHQKLADGTYNLLLQGQMRARLIDESSERAYRLATLEPLAEIPATDLQLQRHRDAMTALFRQLPVSTIGLAGQFTQMLAGPMPTAEVADLAACNFIDDLQTRQALLAEADVLRRVRATVAALAPALAAIHPAPSPLRHDPSLN